MDITTWETESIFSCKYPAEIKTHYKHHATKFNIIPKLEPAMDSEWISEPGNTYEALFSDRAGIVKVYEAASRYCGFQEIEAGKTMGLFPYGQLSTEVPALFIDEGPRSLSNRNLIIPTYPAGAKINKLTSPYLDSTISAGEDVSLLQNRRDVAYATQIQTQAEVVKLIKKAVSMTGNKRVVISGGYGLNCVANYHYLDALKDDGIEIYVEPISNDAGTAMGAAMFFWRVLSQDTTIRKYETLYLGPKNNYTVDCVMETAHASNVEIIDASYSDAVNLLINKNIVTIFQGQSENGPRALGNRSVLFDPRVVDGKDYVNEVKHREYFRPFAGSILQEHTHDWFDLRGMDNSPHMMYAVNCQPGIAEKIPSIIHIDGTCIYKQLQKSKIFITII
jgi:carbamoyltransferase